MGPSHRQVGFGRGQPESSPALHRFLEVSPVPLLSTLGSSAPGLPSTPPTLQPWQVRQTSGDE
ncbi:uncharacterized protein B0I36DRAFT_326340 [Microdochium trichocladiopsis]|uniref:Uncharacterized protein n=1 Tax=Microdochium trichocladiopsis TaxID=1682393 RepID=A0A9P8Y804_9PEZI|nr:uncharacterized protein B0I36DRAFT_326340 [Microdochium trichocladiopsis]KAH7029767.1 hypothetical protein B0I36DRAFT_326340 [Microdochium trichocladiopsis]